MPSFSEHQQVQAIAKEVLGELGPTISDTDTERSIAARAVSMLEQRGVSDTWYHACPALVLLGSRSCLSVSGRDYAPSDEVVGATNLVTVDLSPLLGKAWGDCARSFYVEAGESVLRPSLSPFRQGRDLQLSLHNDLRDLASASTTFGQLHQLASQRIRSAGYENLDFLGNLGHSVEERLGERIFIVADESTCLADVALFTFEPHICEVGGAWGFKHENIYYLDGGRLTEP